MTKLTVLTSGGASIIIKSEQNNLQHIYTDLYKKLQANNQKI